MLARALVETARMRDVTITTAESCTGGGLGFEITRVAGSSKVFLGGIIAYSNSVKSNVLGVSENTLNSFGAVSEQVCHEMALGLADQIPSRMQLAISGIAGPGADGPKPEGLVTFGIGLDQKITTWCYEFGALGRDAVRLKATKMIFDRAHNMILEL